ncbi:hypothetical protein PN36_34695 [Candidatus Thiomargarita nelsonii]|uniref:Pycsar effector protein domain-containing protein n=1 Tax=Candidatus Thiomargarita nelsonii TaxID=1003181 RepID=A0A0A6P330_9GAMM|nr:hypothetical protein PN36_34695 [Candidatus Thiomargarita nelsonii]
MHNENTDNAKLLAPDGENSLDRHEKPSADDVVQHEKTKTNKKPKKRSQHKKEDRKDGKIVGSAKGIETMFRNAYRAELDLIALAAMKANIMISLNGFIVSALMISGGFIYASSPLFLAPATMFLFTSAASIYFALLAASPEMIGMHTGVINWFRDVIKRKATIGDFKAYVKPDNRFINGESNLLIYEDRVKLSKEDYWKLMRELLNDQEDVYAKMSDQLYWLGLMASKKFRMLRASYNIFRWGLILSVLVFIGIKSIMFLMPVTDDAIIHLRNMGISQFEDIYEPSAVQQLQDGRLLIVEDEPSRALSIVEFRQDGSLSEDASLDNRLLRSFHRKLNDLEGLAMSADGYVYAITSHSRTKKGKRKQEREQLLRFKIRGHDLIESDVYVGLTEQLKKSGVLENALKNSVNKNVSLQAINIEAFNFDKEGEKLLLGFREPLIDGKSMIVVVENTVGIFKRGEQPKFSEDVILLNLHGGGIRSLDYDPVLDVYLMVNEARGEDGKNHSQLWSWTGEIDEEPKRIELPSMISLKNVESIAPLVINGESRLLIVSDDGNVKKKRPAKYILLEYDQLSSE